MNKTKQKISVLGCGWLGFALAEHLRDKGHEVKGSMVEDENISQLNQAGIEAYSINFQPHLDKNTDRSFFQSDIIISCIPPSRRADVEQFFPQQMEALRKELIRAKTKKLLFISSTSVYPNTQKRVLESDSFVPEKSSGKALLKAENILLSDKRLDTTVLRLGGLIGYERHPKHFLKGKRQFKNADVPVNLIHRDDCIQIIQEIIDQEYWNGILHACCPEHPTRKTFYTEAAKQAGVELPIFQQGEKAEFKIVDSSKLIHNLNYTFIYKSPLDTICF